MLWVTSSPTSLRLALTVVPGRYSFSVTEVQYD